MGKTHRKIRQIQLEEGAREKTREAEQQRRTQNETRRNLYAYLGSDEQAQNEALDPRVYEYTSRYGYDAGLAGSLVGGDFLQGKDSDPGLEDFGDSIVGGSGTFDDKRRADPDQLRSPNIFSAAKNQANDLLKQAEAAARAGDFTQAAALKAQAEQTLNEFANAQGGIHSGEFREVFNLFENPNARARATGDSSQGRIVGNLLRDAKGLLDTESDTYQRFFGNLTEGSLTEIDAATEVGNRKIALGLESSRGEIRRSSNLRGAGRSVGLEAARYENAQRRAAQSSADIETLAGAERARIRQEASIFLEDYRRRFSQDVVGFAQAFIEGSPDVTENFAGAVERINLSSAQLAAQFSSQVTSVHGNGDREGVGGFIGTVLGAIAGAA